MNTEDRRQKDDWYPTPPEATEALLKCEHFDKDVWEPACGDGAISKVFEAAGHNVHSTDLVDYGFGISGIDFLMERKPFAEQIVTNPPYKMANDFVLHAIDLGIRKHAWLLRLPFLEGQTRYEQIFNKNPPAKVYVFSKRLTIWRGDEDQAWYGTTGKTAYAWFVFSKGWRGPPQLYWI